MSRRTGYRGGKNSVVPTATEKQIHKSVCDYIKMKYPDVIFLSEPSGLKTTIGTAVQLKALRSGSALPDLWVMNPRGGYGALIIEIKKDRSEVFTKDGKLRSSEHIRAQAENLDKLHHLGYYAVFGLGLTHCMEEVDSYMTLALMTNAD